MSATPSTVNAAPGVPVKKKASAGSIVINLARCRYEVVREAAESLGFVVDNDVENLAQTLTKTIEQPNAQLHQQAPLHPSLPPQQQQQRSNLAQLTVSRLNPLPNDGVFAMIESRRAHIIWADVTVSPQQLSSCAVWQRLNHFPGISQTVSRKVPLAQTMMRAWKQAPEFFADLVPLSFSLKRDNALLRQYFEEIEYAFMNKKKKAVAEARAKARNQPVKAPSANPFLTYFGGDDDDDDDDDFSSGGNDSASDADPAAPTTTTKQQSRPRVFIFKPNGGCMGHDIKLTVKPLQMMQKLLTGNITTTKHLKEDEDFVVQAYIDRPMLIEKRKFDLRVYVLLMGVSPDLRILVHREGLVRICASEYVQPKASNVRNATVHLTNYAVNKKKLGKSCDAAKSHQQQQQQQQQQQSSDVDGGDNSDDDDDGDDDDDDGGGAGGGDAIPSADTAPAGQTLRIGGIKRDFAFLNAMLDAEYARVGGAAEIWRRIDRAMVLTLIAAHGELDRTYRQASAANNVLLRRAALQHIKEQKAKLARAQQDFDACAVGADEDDDDEAADNDSGGDDDDDSAPSASQQPEEPTLKLPHGVDEETLIHNCSIGRNCFELLGFDLLLTDTGAPVVMEVNHGPSLECGAEIDRRIKFKVLQDVFRHTSVYLPDARKRELRQRRCLQRVIKKKPTADLILKCGGAGELLLPSSGFRVAYPLVAPFESPEHARLAVEYQKAKEALDPESVTSAAAAAAGAAAPVAAAPPMQRRSSFSGGGSDAAPRFSTSTSQHRVGASAAAAAAAASASATAASRKMTMSHRSSSCSSSNKKTPVRSQSRPKVPTHAQPQPQPQQQQHQQQQRHRSSSKKRSRSKAGSRSQSKSRGK